MAIGTLNMDNMHSKDIEGLKSKDKEILENITNIQNLLGDVDINSVGSSITEILKRTNYKYTADSVITTMPDNPIPGIYRIYIGDSTFPYAYGVLIIYRECVPEEYAALYLSSGVDNNVYYSIYNKHHNLNGTYQWGPWKNLTHKPVNVPIALLNSWTALNGDTYIVKDSNYVTVHLILRNSTIPTDPKVVSIGDKSIIPPNYKVYRATLTDVTQTIMPVECTCTIDPEGFITVHTYGDTSGLTDVWLFLEVVYSLF